MGGTTKKKNSQSIFETSPSTRNLLELSNQTFEHRSAVPFGQMLEDERSKFIQKNTRSQSIIMQDFHERKARMNLDKKISKKLQRAEKNKEKALKD